MRVAMTLLIVVGMVLGGCAHDPSRGNTPAPGAQLVSINLTADEALRWDYRQDLSADLDGDGVEEVVTLVSDVVMSNGRPLWEDGHRWAVVVADGDARTLAYAAFVPRGFAEAAVLRESSDGSREILVNQRTPEQMMTVAIAYRGPGEVNAASSAYYQVESWFAGSARM